MSTVTITLTLDEAAAIALATVIRRVSPSEYADALTEREADGAVVKCRLFAGRNHVGQIKHDDRMRGCADEIESSYT